MKLDPGTKSPRVCPVQKNMTQAVARRRQESQQTKDMRPSFGGKNRSWRNKRQRTR